MGAHGVEEVTVVTNDQHGVLEIAQILLEPGYSLHVEVVGGLVEEEIVGVAEEGLGQHDTHLLLTAEFAHQKVVLVLLDAQSAKQGSGIAFGIPAFEFGKFFLQLGYLQTVLVAEVGFGIECIALVHDVPQHGVAHQYGVEYGVLIPLEVVLTEHGESLVGAKGDTALGGLQIATDSAQEGGLACSIGTNDSVDVSVSELQVDILVQHSFSKLNG